MDQGIRISTFLKSYSNGLNLNDTGKIPNEQHDEKAQEDPYNVAKDQVTLSDKR